MGELKHKNCGIKEVDEGQIFIIKVYCNRADFSSVTLLSERWIIRAEAGNVSFLISLYWGNLTLIDLLHTKLFSSLYSVP